MYINSIYYRDNLFNITVEKTEFNPLNLLVGASGSGKTMIINSLSNLKEIALGKSGFPGAEWKLNFTTTGGQNVVWSGTIEKATMPAKILNDLKGNESNNILVEKIRVNNKLYANRVKDNLNSGTKNFKIENNTSAIAAGFLEKLNIFRDEFKKIIVSDNSPLYDFKAGKFAVDSNLATDGTQYKLAEIKKLNINTSGKLFLTYKNETETFNHIKERFIEIFPFVEDIKIAPYFIPDIPVESKKMQEHPVIQIKEKYGQEWVHETYISSGMLRTLLKIAEIELADEGSVIIIDELENSLGVNSLEILVDEIKYSEGDIQFIITSHHPYIIQNIESETWKLVKREKNKIVTLSAEKIGIGLSKHDQFFELLNTEDYRKGIASE